MKLFPNFTSMLFDYLFITWVSNYVRNRGSLRSMAVLSSRAHERRSCKKNKNRAPQSPRGFSALAPLLLPGARNQNRHATQATNRGFWTCLSWFYRIDRELHTVESWLRFRILPLGILYDVLCRVFRFSKASLMPSHLNS